MSPPPRTGGVPDPSITPPSGLKRPPWMVASAALGGVLLLALGALVVFGNPWADSDPGPSTIEEPDPSDPEPVPSEQQPATPPADDSS